MMPRPEQHPNGSWQVYQERLADWRIEAAQDAADRIERAVERLSAVVAMLTYRLTLRQRISLALRTRRLVWNRVTRRIELVE